MSNDFLENFQKNIGARLKTWREHQGMKLYELSEAIGIDTGSLSKVERGQGGLRNDKLFVIFSKFGINLNWLLSGQGAMLVGDVSPAPEVATAGTGPPQKRLQACQECGQPLNVGALLESQERMISEKERLIQMLQSALAEKDEVIRLQKESARIMEPAKAGSLKVG